MRPTVAVAEPESSIARGRASPAFVRWVELVSALAGGRAETELLVGLHTVLRAGHHVLDAGSRGAMAVHVRRIQPAATVVLADLASGRRLPFTDGAFDVVVCAWGLERSPNPALAMSELARVLAPGGTLLACYRSVPDGWIARTSAAVARRIGSRWAPGRALGREEVPLPRLDTTRISRFAGGLTTFVHGRAAAPRHG